MKTVQVFIDCLPEGADLKQSVAADVFFAGLLGEEIGQDNLRKMFNAFHETCPNFVVGEDDCPDCLAKHGY